MDPGGVSDPRTAALWVIERTLVSGRPAANWSRRVESGLEGLDRALLHQLVIGVLRWLLRLDDVLVQVGGKPIGMIDPRLLGPLRLGALQLLFLDRIPPHAAVHESVRLAHDRSHPGSRFVNALLRKLSTDPDLGRFPVRSGSPAERLAVETSHPVYLVERWQARFGEQRTRQMLAANNGDRKATLLAVEGPGARQALIQELAAEGVETSPCALSPIGLRVDSGRAAETRAFRRGALYFQDEASQCAALVPLPAAGERILDAAAAPGGKTLSLLARQAELRIVASDRSVARTAMLMENRRRTGRRFEIVVSDAISPAFGSAFDRVVADLPCTGTGTIRKHPEIKWRVNQRELGRLTREASRLLDGLAPLVVPGGLLVISTCSIEPEENEHQVASFVDRHPGFEPVDLRQRVPAGTDSALECRGRWRLLPTRDHDGFTVHALRSTSVQQ